MSRDTSLEGQNSVSCSPLGAGNVTAVPRRGIICFLNRPPTLHNLVPEIAPSPSFCLLLTLLTRPRGQEARGINIQDKSCVYLPSLHVPQSFLGIPVRPRTELIMDNSLWSLSFDPLLRDGHTAKVLLVLSSSTFCC